MKYKWFMAVMIAAMGILMGAGNPEAGQAAGQAGSPGITRPSERRQLSLKNGDVIRKVLVKPGDVVKAGQMLVEEDTREEEKNLEIIKLEAQSEAAVNAAQVIFEVSKITLASKEVEFKRVEEMYNNKVATISEYDKAKLDVDISKQEIEKSKWDVEKAKMENAQRKVQMERQMSTLDRMRIYSPFDGVVEEVMLKEGEVIEPGKPVVIVVKNDVLWVEALLPSGVSMGMKPGQDVKVKYGFEETTRTGKLIYMNPVVDAGSGLQLIRLELANPENRPAGLPVTVYP